MSFRCILPRYYHWWHQTHGRDFGGKLLICKNLCPSTCAKERCKWQWKDSPQCVWEAIQDTGHMHYSGCHLACELGSPSLCVCRYLQQTESSDAHWEVAKVFPLSFIFHLASATQHLPRSSTEGSPDNVHCFGMKHHLFMYILTFPVFFRTRMWSSLNLCFSNCHTENPKTFFVLQFLSLDLLTIQSSAKVVSIQLNLIQLCSDCPRNRGKKKSYFSSCTEMSYLLSLRSLFFWAQIHNTPLK